MTTPATGSCSTAGPVAVMGFSLTIPGVSLPLALDSYGMPGCTLHIAPEATALLASQNGSATWSLSIPAHPSLLGVTFHQQAAVMDPGANATGMVMSNASRGVVGGR